MNILTKERLQQLAIEDDLVNYPPEQWELNEMARQLLAGLEQEPVAWQWLYRDKCHVTNDPDRAKFVAEDGDVTVQPLYVAPQLPQPAVADGWAAVPVEPTREMIEATFVGEMELQSVQHQIRNRERRAQYYRAMLAAAPDFRGISNSSTRHFRESAETSTKCWCHTCRPVTMANMRFVVCPECGNKRCPHANDHRNACTGSNEPGQEGSAYPAPQ